MLLDSVINYAIGGIKKTFKVDGLILKAKTVEESKLKFKFERMGMKIQIEIPNSDLASIVYYNFLDEEVREDIFEAEFVSRFKEYLQVCNPLEEGEVEKFVKKMCDDIRSTKLFKSNGQAMKKEKELTEEEKYREGLINQFKELKLIGNPEEMDTGVLQDCIKDYLKSQEEQGTKELGYKAPAQLGYEEQEEPQEEIQEAEIVEDEEEPGEEFLEEEEKEEENN